MVWDMMIVILLSYTAFMTPLSIGFAGFGDGNEDSAFTNFVLDTLVDFLFLADVIINFFTSFERDDGFMEYSLGNIALSYLGGFFTIDLVSSIPFDLIYKTNSENSGGAHAAGAAKTLKASKVLKVLRILKLTKLLRMARALKVTRRLEEELDLVGRTPMKLSKIALSTLFMAHINACGWALMARLNGIETFYTESWAAEWGCASDDEVRQYIVALYWSVTTLTTVGYGDVSPRSNEEILYATISMIIGGAFYGYVVAMLAALMQGLDANARVYNERMEAIVSYMRQRKFPRALFRRVARYYHHYYLRKTALNEQAILSELSASLRHEVAHFLAHDIFLRTYLFKHLKDIILMRLLGLLFPLKCATDEVVFRSGEPGTEIYIISMGEVFSFDNTGKILDYFKPGDIFGEYTPLGLVPCRLFHCQCRTMVEMCTISRMALKEACVDDDQTLQTCVNLAEVRLRKFREENSDGHDPHGELMQLLMSRKASAGGKDPDPDDDHDDKKAGGSESLVTAIVPVVKSSVGGVGADKAPSSGNESSSGSLHESGSQKTHSGALVEAKKPPIDQPKAAFSGANATAVNTPTNFEVERQRQQQPAWTVTRGSNVNTLSSHISTMDLQLHSMSLKLDEAMQFHRSQFQSLNSHMLQVTTMTTVIRWPMYTFGSR